MITVAAVAVGLAVLILTAVLAVVRAEQDRIKKQWEK
jgi:hypothetical protein